MEGSIQIQDLTPEIAIIYMYFLQIKHYASSKPNTMQIQYVEQDQQIFSIAN